MSFLKNRDQLAQEYGVFTDAIKIAGMHIQKNKIERTMKTLILDKQKFPIVWLTLIGSIILCIDVLKWNNTIQSKIILGAACLLSVYVGFVKYQSQRESGAPMFTWKLLLPLFVLLGVLVYTFLRSTYVVG